MARGKKQIGSEARALFAEGSAGVAGWTVQETPWADPYAAQIRTAGGKLIGEIADPDDAKLIVSGLKLLRELTEEHP